MPQTIDAAFYGTRLSANISKTPEGYLICHNVPIARTGVQQYIGTEIGLDHSNIVKVYRLPEEVFNPATLASFEGKPLTDNHPSGLVSVDNVNALFKGVAQNVKRGSGEDIEHMVSDLVLYDPTLINETENGNKREISCGYNCEYEPYKDGYKQVNIRGNHIAVVPQGRAGQSIAIKDSNESIKRRKPMSKKSILSKMFAVFAKDAEPEEIEKALDAISEQTEEPKQSKDCKAKDEELEEKKKDEESETTKETLHAIIKRLDALDAKISKDEDEEGVKALEEFAKEEKENKGDEKDETLDTLITAESASEIAPEDKPENPITGDALKAVVKDLLPTIANMKDGKAKKTMVDALNKAIRTSRGLNAKATTNDYATAQKIIASNTTKDSKIQESPEDYGKMIMANYNLHTKKETK